MLILCGSLINMMTSQVLSYNSPLYGRRTAQIKKEKMYLDALIEKAVYINWKKKERNERFVIYSKSGFTKELKEFAKKREGILLLEMGIVHGFGCIAHAG